ncbi:MAG: tetratricopeptide repeat protein, partial [Blastocatellia bacterium]
PIGMELTDQHQNNSRYRRELTICYDKVGNALSATHDYVPALDYFRKSLAIREQLSSLDPQNAVARRDLSVSYDKIGSTLKELKQKSEALGYFKKALDNDQALWEADKTNSQAHEDLSISMLEYADMQLSTGDGAGALDNYRKSAAIREQLCKDDPTNAGLRVELAESYGKIGDGLSSLASRKFGAASDWTEAQGWYRKALSILTALRDAKTLPESSSKDIEEVTGKLAKCEAALRVQGHGG